MDLLKLPGRRSKVSEIAYIGLNVGLALLLFFMATSVESPIPAVVIVLLSKWRILAVRPRFWKANILANLVDIILSLSVVALLYAATGTLFMQIALTAFYCAWLLFIKPRSKRSFVAAQAAITLFFGITALYTVGYALDPAIIVLGMFVIGYSTARHLCSSYDEIYSGLYSLVWGLVVAEFGWLLAHWTFVYSLPGFGGVKMVQGAIIISLLGFVAERAYHSKKTYESIRSKDIIMPILLAISVIFVIMTFYNSLIGDAGF